MLKPAFVCVAIAGCGVAEPPSGVTTSSETSYDCMTVSAGQGFVSIPIENATVLDTVAYTITTDTAPIDAVVGLSAGAPTAFSNFAISARLAPSGQVDARNGGTYSAYGSYAYQVGSPMQFRIVADLTTHTYALEDPGGGQIGADYQFRTEQSSVTHLDHFGVIVDSSTGTVQVCPTAAASRGVRYSRDGLYAISAMPDGRALFDDFYTTLTTFDVSGHPLASVARHSGFSFTDTLGNVFYVTLSNNVLSLEKLDSNLVSQWIKTRTLPDGHVILAYKGDGNGGAVIATRNYSAGSVTIFRFTSAGVFLGSHSTLGTGAVVDGNSAFIVRGDESSMKISKYSTAWQLLWSKTYTGSTNMAAAMAAPDGGIVFGGSMSSPMDFGGGTLSVDTGSERHNGYLVRLASDGSHVFSQRTDGDWTRALATNGHWIVVSDTRTTQQLPYARLAVLTMTGTPAPDAPAFDTSLGPLGQGLEVALSADNRIYWNMFTNWPSYYGYEYQLAL